MGYSKRNHKLVLSASVLPTLALPATVLWATTIAAWSCATTMPESPSRPSLQGAEPEQATPESGPVDLRVTLEDIVLERDTESADSSHVSSGHEAASLQLSVEAHRLELAGCLTDSLAGVETMFTMSIEIDESGAVLGGSTSPAPGREGLSKIAGCVLAQGRGWLLPTRDRRGRTILIIPFVIASD